MRLAMERQYGLTKADTVDFIVEDVKRKLDGLREINADKRMNITVMIDMEISE